MTLAGSLRLKSFSCSQFYLGMNKWILCTARLVASLVKTSWQLGVFSPGMLFLSKINAKGQMSLDVPGLLLSFLLRVVWVDVSVMILKLSCSALQAGSVVILLHFSSDHLLFLREKQGKREWNGSSTSTSCGGSFSLLLQACALPVLP